MKPALITAIVFADVDYSEANSVGANPRAIEPFTFELHPLETLTLIVTPAVELTFVV